MIRDADLWKADLRATRDSLAKLAKQKMHGRRTHVSIEKALFLGFYAVRKLLLDGHLTSAVTGCTVPVTTFTSRGLGFNRHDQHLLDRWYAMDNPTSATLSLRFICNQFVHSFVFMIQMEQDASIAGFYVTSDDFKKKSLYFVSLADILHLFSVGGNDGDGSRDNVNRASERPCLSLAG